MPEYRHPEPDEQKVIHAVMTDHFEDMTKEPGGLASLYAEEETILFLSELLKAGYAPEPVEFISRLALQDAIAIHSIKAITPGDFLR